MAIPKHLSGPYVCYVALTPRDGDNYPTVAFAGIGLKSGSRGIGAYAQVVCLTLTGGACSLGTATPRSAFNLFHKHLREQLSYHELC